MYDAIKIQLKYIFEKYYFTGLELYSSFRLLNKNYVIFI